MKQATDSLTYLNTTMQTVDAAYQFFSEFISTDLSPPTPFFIPIHKFIYKADVNTFQLYFMSYLYRILPYLYRDVNMFICGNAYSPLSVYDISYFDNQVIVRSNVLKMDKCLKQPSRFIVFFIGQMDVDQLFKDTHPHVNHGNALIYDKKTNVIEYFDPLHIDKNVSKSLKSEMDLFFQRFNITPKKWVIYNKKKSNRPIQSKQWIEYLQPPYDPYGFCHYWSIFVCELKKKYPDLLLDDSFDYVVDFCRKNRLTLTEFIRNYTKHLYYQIYLVLYVGKQIDSKECYLVDDLFQDKQLLDRIFKDENVEEAINLRKNPIKEFKKLFPQYKTKLQTTGKYKIHIMKPVNPHFNDIPLIKYEFKLHFYEKGVKLFTLESYEINKETFLRKHIAKLVEEDSYLLR